MDATRTKDQAPPSEPFAVQTMLSGSWRHQLSIIAILALGVSVSISTYWAVREWDARREFACLGRHVQVQSQAIGQQLHAILADVQTLARFHDAAEMVQPERFARFSTPFFAREPAIQALGWTTLVRDADRAAFEAQARTQGLADFSIQEGQPGARTRAARRDAYFPLLRVTSVDADLAPGDDLGTDAACLVALTQARQTGAAAITVPLTTDPQTDLARRLAIFVPLTGRDRDGDPERFAVGLVRMDRLLMADTNVLRGHHDHTLVLRDTAVPGAAGLLHVFAPLGQAAETPLDLSALAESDQGQTVPIEIAGRVLELRAIHASGSAPGADWPLILLLLGLATSLILAILFQQRRDAIGRLYERERLFRLFMDHIPALAWIKDTQLRYIYTNRAYQEHSGACMDGWRGKTDFALWPQAIAEAFQAEDLEVMTSNSPKQINETTNLSGVTRYWRTLKMPFQDRFGRRYAGGISLEVTAQHEARAALEAQSARLETLVADRTAELERLNERLQLATETGGIGIWDWDILSDRLTWDARTYRLHGRAPQDAAALLGDTWYACVHPEDLPNVDAAFKQCLKTDDGLRNLGLRVQWPDGTLRHLTLSGKVVRRDTHGTACRMLGVVWDVTSEQLAASALLASEARARDIIESSPVPLGICDGSREILYLNTAFVHTFGYNHEDIPTLQSWSLRAYPDPDYRQWVLQQRRERLDKSAHDASPFEPLEVKVHCKDGTKRTIVVTSTALNGEGASGTHLSSFYDVTELRQAREEAEQAAQVKSEFLANMSHELRTPMNAMLGLAQLLERSALSADQRHLVGLMRSAGESLLDIIEDVLDLSKLDAGRLELEIRPFAPDAILARIQSLMGRMARAKGLDFSIESPANLDDRLLGDPLRLEQTLINLVGNAIKFTEHGEIKVSVQRQAFTPAQGATPARVQLRFEITDTGIGIAPERLDELFAPFVQADGTISRRFGGTGLGLSITRDLVDLMGGTLGVDSLLGVGSTFWVELSFDIDESATEPVSEGADQQPTGAPLSGLCCLVVDDSPMNLDIMGRILKREGALATLVSDASQALDLLRAQPQAYHCVLMDIQMPGIDGLTATRIIREELGLIDLPVIAFSAGARPEQRRQATEAGVNGFLAKPLDLDEMIAELSGLMPSDTSQSQHDAPVQNEADAAQREGAFPDIPGLDTHRAACLLDHDLAFFLTLLRQLATDFADATERIREDLQQGKRSEAVQRLHSLRGNAGNLGALNLMRAAQTLEDAITAQRDTVAILIPAFDGQLNAFLDATAPWRQAHNPPSPSHTETVLDKASLAALHDALSCQDLAALELFKTLQPALTLDASETTQALAEAIHALRFADAAHLLADRFDFDAGRS